MRVATLTKRETEIAELFAWGASKKDVANRLFISEKTVENHTRNIYEKVGCSKVNELSAWWFCTRFHISFDLSPLRRKMLSFALLLIMLPQVVDYNKNDMVRPSARTTRTVRSSRTRTREDNNDGLLIY